MDEAVRIRRKDTTKGPPLRVLSLDGGGVRGYSMLIILQELMHRTFVEMHDRPPKRHEIPKPCDHFDLIAGTGTGGLIAIMLGRLRLDIDTCKDVYVRMTRRVFETDKTFAGIPYRSTLFKASKLEEVIRECVREHTVFEDEGNDTLANATPMSSAVEGTASPFNSATGPRQPHRTVSQDSRYSHIGMSPKSHRGSMGLGTLQWGNQNALLYDTRENRTKTAVTAVYKGTRKDGKSQLLRSYDSRKEPAPDVNCSIWQAGRATTAIGLAFKAIQIGQSVYTDEGAGKYNPAPQILDEAIQNEWPGRELGVFVSIGTGKRPGGTNNMKSEWWEGFLGGTMGDFAEARKRLMMKIEGCEETHQYMMREHLPKRGVDVENYFRLNVEVGVGEFGVNEWARLSDISTNTRMYLSKSQVQGINLGAAAKLARIHFAKIRWDRTQEKGEGEDQSHRYSWQGPWDKPLPPAAPANPMAVELPADDQYYQTQAFRPGNYNNDNNIDQYMHRPSIADQKYIVISSDEYPQSADGNAPQTAAIGTPPQQASHHPSGSAPSSPDLSTLSPTSPPNYHPPPPPGSHSSQHHRHHSHTISSATSYNDPSPGVSPRVSSEHQPLASAPPVPPKTPLPYPDQLSPSMISPTAAQQQQQNATIAGPEYSTAGGDYAPKTFINMGELGRRLPYPDVEGPPPAVNAASKPQITR